MPPTHLCLGQTRNRPASGFEDDPAVLDESIGLLRSHPSSPAHLPTNALGPAAASWMSALLCSLEPDLNFVAIRIGDVSVGEAGSELATTEQASSGAFDLGDGTVDVVGVHEPKAEMRDAAPETGRGGVLGKGEDVVPTRRL